MAEVSAEVAARDAEIFAAAEKLGTENRRQIAEHLGFSPARVQAAFKRRDGVTTSKGGRAPSHVLQIAQSVTLTAARSDRGKSLPIRLRRALAPLQRRDGWEAELAAAVELALAPPQLELLPSDGEQLGGLAAIEHRLRSMERFLDKPGLSSSDYLRATQIYAQLTLSAEKLRPAAEVVDAIPREQIPEAALSGKAKLRQVAARLRQEREATIAQLLEAARERGGDYYQGVIDALRALGALPGKEETDEDRETV